MSNLRHRQPAWRWSVVLLSTALLLSPAAARALLCALASAQQAGVVAMVPAPSSEPADHRQAAAAQAPRRSEEEDAAALRAAADLAGDEIDGTRLDPSAPVADLAADAVADAPPAAALAFLVPSRADVLVPDAGPTVSPTFASAPPGPSPRRAAARALPPRAPPVSV